MKHKHLFNVELTSYYGKSVEATIAVDRHGDFSIDQIVINGNVYSGKQIRTARRENILLNYIEQFIELDRWVSDEMYDRENHHFVD